VRPSTFAAICLAACVTSAVVVGCRQKASPTMKHSQQARLRQADRGDAILNAAAHSLNDLPSAADTELRPPVVILDARKSINGMDVLATCTTNPRSPDGMINLVRVPAGNSGFRNRISVTSGDIVRYYVLEDKTVDPDAQRAGMSRQVAMELQVAQVVDDNTLLLESGLNQEVTQPHKLEIWRNADERLAEIQEKLGIYRIHRLPEIGWETAPDEQVLRQVLDWLNQWIRQGDPKTSWNQNSLLLDTLSPKLRDDKDLAKRLATAALAARSFQPEDTRFLQEAIWLRDISRWAHGDELDDVSRAAALFDWSARNIQLQSDADAEPHRPWQTLLYGRGTAEQRALVFALLCRQQGLDVVMLSIPGKDNEPNKSAAGADAQTNAAQFWLPALLSEGQLYLFDARLGLPVPGAEGKGVATLEQVRKDNSLLRHLDLEGTPYQISADNLKSIEIDLIADPFSLSRRAAQLESSLAGDDRVILSAKPADLAAKAKSISGVSVVRLWDFPFQTIHDQLTLGKAAREREVFEFEPFAVRPALWKARSRHFQGRREDPKNNSKKNADEAIDDHRDAASYYLSKTVRPPDRKIAESTSDDERRIDSTAKLDAAYWLGLLSYDDGKFPVAASWFARPELLAPASPWAFGASYNLARSLEAQAKFEEAVAILERDNSPQQQGNKLRARELKSKAKQAVASKKGE
jgi:hypothetical protein